MPRQSARMRQVARNNVTPIRDPETAAYLAQLKQMDEDERLGRRSHLIDDEAIDLELEDDYEDEDDDEGEVRSGISTRVVICLVFFSGFLMWCVGYSQGLGAH